MFTTVLVSSDESRAIMLRSHHRRNTPRERTNVQKKRYQSVYGTKSYRDAVQRAFNKAKQQIYFNPDMTNFITLTYRQADNTPEQVMQDIKVLLTRESREQERSFPAGSGRKTPKYIYIMEYQDRGSIHVHMIANDFFTLQVNSNGYDELVYWPHGFTSVLRINDFNNNFRPHLYLFKYMRKAQRIGKSFVHSSRNLNNYKQLTDEEFNFRQYNTINMEYTSTEVNSTFFQFYRNYLQIDDTMTLQQSNDTHRKVLEQWKQTLQSHSNKALAEIQANRTQHSS